LGAGPSAENAAKDHCEQNDEYDERDHADTENKKILWPEYHAKNDEFPLQHIQHEERFIIHFYEGKAEEYYQVKNAEERTPVVQLPIWFFGKQVIAFTLFCDGSN
jgi:hypothetical protein